MVNKTLVHVNFCFTIAGMKKLTIIILVTAAICGISYVSWNFYQAKQVKNSQQATQQGSNTKAGPIITDPSEGGKYLVIKEWGVRTLNDPLLTNLNYSYKSEGDGEPSTVTFSTDLLDSLSANCANKVASSWKIIRYYPDNPSPVPADEESSQSVLIKNSPYVPNQNIKQISKNYFQRIYPQIPCSESDKQTMQSLENAYLKQFNVLEALP